MAQSAPHIAIVIVGFRNADDIRRCVTALAEQTYQNFEIVIVENGGLAAYAQLQSFASTMVARSVAPRVVNAGANLGFAGGVNRGMAETTQSDAWWILNPDTEPDPIALEAMIARLTRGDCDAVGGVLHYESGRIQSLGGHWQGWVGRATSLGSGSHLSDPVDADEIERRIDYLLGASMLVGRKFVETVGPMRDDYFLYAEEVEWFLRSGQHGMRLGFAPDARVLHHQGTTTGWANQLRGRGRLPIYLDERNRLLVTRDRLPARFPAVMVTSLMFMILRFGTRRAWRQLVYGFQGWFAGIRGERGRPAWLQADP